jgi:hypothetical protein
MSSTSIIVFLNILGLVLTNPVSNEQSGNRSLEQANRQAQILLNRYYHLINSDTDHLVHGMLHALINNPTSFPYIPYRAMNIAFKNVGDKLGHDQVEILTKPLLLAIDQNYLSRSKQPSPPVKLNDKTKEKIEQALDKFLEDAEFDPRL